MKARKDIELICDRPLLNPIPKNGKLYKQDGAYTLKRKEGNNEVHKVLAREEYSNESNEPLQSLRDRYFADWFQKHKWDTDAWRKKSKSGKRNRNSNVNGSISIHTGGSITTEQHRAKLTKEKGNKPSWGDVFRQTHLEKSAKLRLASGESIGNQPEHWVNKRSWTVFDTYEKAMSEKYGPDPTQHPLGDAEIWEHSGGGRKKGQVYGVGSSDPSYTTNQENSGLQKNCRNMSFNKSTSFGTDLDGLINLEVLCHNSIKKSPSYIV
ncbi:hypothetical protein L2E82_23041 [Cichorium intybus]|uniref:Uncharacterized protein n=1 Tax=Cichorium intybus TaxID=13427 RepID=A0ACB9E0E2_CICIN|nr:hypothetical protein L2E82_23041 [Cichorium intybus]